MSLINPPVARIKDLANKINKIEDVLMSNQKISLAEQSKMHSEISKFKKELDDLEKRTRSQK